MTAKSTKIVATIGPATESEEQIKLLIEAGMNVARFNTKHSEPAWHNERVQRVRKVAKEMKQPIAILLDLQGPEVRINLPNETPIEVAKGEMVMFTHQTERTDGKLVFIPENVVTSLKPGDSITLEDGACEFVVRESQPNQVVAEAMLACTVKHRKTMNTPGVVLDMPSLTERDFSYLDAIKPDDIDFVGLSFVRNKSDIAQLRHELEVRNFSAGIIAKIENQNALDNLDEICEAADGLMVARGDLGVEVPYQELTYWQKTIITKARLLSKPVITATEMLKSMIEKPRPTRAEVSDVAHAIYDGTDAVMLSEETTIGKHPVKAVQTQATIAAFNEQHAQPTLDDHISDSTTEAVTTAAIGILESSELPIDKIICLTETGMTAQMVSRFRPHIPIITLTHDIKTWYKLALSYGVQPVLFEKPDHESLTEEAFIEDCRALNLVASGEYILLIRGKFWRKPGFTNTISVIQVP